MSYVVEVMEGFAFIKATLIADNTLTGLATGGVWRDLAPVSTVPPFIVMVNMTAPDVTTMNAYHILSRPTYQVKAVGPASMTATLVTIAENIDRLLGGTTPVSGFTSKAYISSSYRESGLTMSEIVGGEQWENIGGIYHLDIQKL